MAMIAASSAQRDYAAGMAQNAAVFSDSLIFSDTSSLLKKHTQSATSADQALLASR